MVSKAKDVGSIPTTLAKYSEVGKLVKSSDFESETWRFDASLPSQNNNTEIWGYNSDGRVTDF